MSEIDWRDEVRELERADISKSEAKAYCLAKLANLNLEKSELRHELRKVERAIDSVY
jgi:hypothetical protein